VEKLWILFKNGSVSRSDCKPVSIFVQKTCCFSTAAKLNGAISPLVLSTPRVVQMHSFGTKQQNFESQLHSNQANSWKFLGAGDGEVE